MSENFLKAHPFVAKWEGGLDDDPVDAGGITKYGVSFAFLTDVAKESQANRETLHRMSIKLPVTKDTIRNLTRDQSVSLFQWQFWLRLNLDRFPLRVATVLYDAAVNCGRGTSVKLMQRGCIASGLLSGKGAERDDGILGKKTEAAFMAADNEKTLELAIVARENYYKAIVRSKPKQARFINGWLNRTRDLRKYLRGL